MTKILFLLATAGMLTTGASAGAFAQGVAIGNVDIRALEAPVDVTTQQLRAQSARSGQGAFFFTAPAARY